MKTFLFTLACLFLLVGAGQAQVDISGKGTGNTITITNDNATINGWISDSLAQVHGFIGDSLAQFFTADTSTLQSLDWAEGRVVYVLGMNTSLTPNVGGGWYAAKDSSFVEGKYAFQHPTQGLQWVSLTYLLFNTLFIPPPNSTSTADIQHAVSFTQYNDAVSIVFPSDSLFTITDTIELPDNDIRIYGNGASITTGTSTHPVFYRTHHDNFTYIDGLTFYGDGEAFEFNATPSNVQYYEFEIKDCKFLQDSATYAIKLDGSREGKIFDCFFEDNDGIYIQASVNVEVVNCDFKNTTFSVDYDGDETGFSAGLKVVGGFSLGVDSAFVLKGLDHAELVNVMADFCDNPVVVQGVNGGLIQGGFYASRTANPTISIDTTGTGLTGSTQHFKIIGAQILGYFDTDSTHHCISIVDAAHTHIAFNTIHFWTGYGIKDSSSTFTIIDHNRIAPRPGWGKTAGGVYSILDNAVNRITENNFAVGYGVTRSNALVYSNTNSGISAVGAASFVTVDSSAFANPGKLHYGGQSSLTEKWGSTGYVKQHVTLTYSFPQPFETAIFGIQLTPFSNVDSSSYKYSIVGAWKDSVQIRFWGTDSATFFYRAIGY
jgi:hypothetical protein